MRRFLPYILGIIGVLVFSAAAIKIEYKKMELNALKAHPYLTSGTLEDYTTVMKPRRIGVDMLYAVITIKPVNIIDPSGKSLPVGAPVTFEFPVSTNISTVEHAKESVMDTAWRLQGSGELVRITHGHANGAGPIFRVQKMTGNIPEDIFLLDTYNMLDDATIYCLMGMVFLSMPIFSAVNKRGYEVVLSDLTLAQRGAVYRLMYAAAFLFIAFLCVKVALRAID